MTVTILSKKYTKQDLFTIANSKSYDATIPWVDSFFSFIRQWFQDTPTILVQSSGSTGNPKIIELQKKDMIASAARTISTFDIPTESTMLLCMDCKYIGAMMMVVRAIVNKSHLVVVSPADLSSTEIQAYTFDFVAMVPLQLDHLLQQKFPVDTHFKTIIIGGGSLSNSLKSNIAEQVHQAKIFETFGMTETISHIAFKPYNETYFRLIPQVEIKLNEKECMMLRDGLIDSSWMETNDIIELDKNQTSFRFVGRYDFIINSGGIKMNPEKIESLLSTSINCNILCIGIPDEKLGEQLILLIEGEPFELDSAIFETLPRYEKPKQIRFMAHFAYLPNQKPDRKKTKMLFLESQRI